MGTIYEFSRVSGQEYVFQVNREQTETAGGTTITESFVSAANNDQTYSLNPPPASLQDAGTLLFSGETEASPSPDQSLLDIWDRAGTDSFYRGITSRVTALMNDKNKQPFLVRRSSGQRSPDSGFIYMDNACVDSLADNLKPQAQAQFYCSYVKDFNPTIPGIDEIFIVNIDATKSKSNATPSDGSTIDGLFLAGTRVLTWVNSKI